MGKWKRLKRKLRRLFHPNVFDMKAAIRLGRMLERKKVHVQLPPIFDGHPVYIAIPQQVTPSPVYEPPERHTDPLQVLHQRLEARRAIMQHSTIMIRKTILLSAADEPPPEDETMHETPAWIV